MTFKIKFLIYKKFKKIIDKILIAFHDFFKHTPPSHNCGIFLLFESELWENPMIDGINFPINSIEYSHIIIKKFTIW